MEFQLIKTTACLTSLGLCGAILGCQSADKQEYYQPHSHRADMVQQVPLMPRSQSVPMVQQPMAAPSQSHAMPGPVYTPKQRPTLIAPPGHQAPPMAPPVVPGVAPYGAPEGGLRPVPAPTSWLPGQPGPYLPTSYESSAQVATPWGLELNSGNGSGLIRPGQSNAEQLVPIHVNAPGGMVNAGQTMFAPGWQERQANVPPQANLLSGTPANPYGHPQWGMPVAFNDTQVPQQFLAVPPRQPDAPQRPEPIMISPFASDLVEAWPSRMELAEPEVMEEFQPDPDSIRAFLAEELPVIQPEIRHRLMQGQTGIEPMTLEKPAANSFSVPETNGPLMIP